MMKKLSLSLVLCGSFIGYHAPLMAEDVRMPVGASTSSYSGALPARGSSKAQVEADFGSPNSKNGPNGQPPIYYWEYSDFTVYFESGYVIHTVLKNIK